MILLIVAHHLIVHGGTYPYSEASELQHHFAGLLETGGKLGVDGFVLISGYFLCTTSAIDPRKLVKLVSQLLTYSIVIALLFLAFDSAVLNDVAISRLFFNAVLPVGFSTWWFASLYLLLVLLAPLLNIVIGTMTKTHYRWLLAIGFMYLSVLPTYLSQTWASSDLVWFIYLYFVAGYLRLHRPRILNHPGIAGLVGLFLYVLNSVMLVRVSMHPLPGVISQYFSADMKQENPLVFGSSVLIFILFLGLRLGSVSIVNTIATGSFGVYLIHDHPYVREWLWHDMLKPAEHYANGTNFYLYAVGIVISVYALGTSIDIVRQHLCERPIMRLWDRIWARKRRLQDAVSPADP